MAEDLARLVVKMEAEATKLHKELDRANKKISKFERKTHSSMKRVSDSFKNVFAGAALGYGIARFGQAVIQTSMSIQQLKVQLETVTGSAKNAEKAFDMVQDFASSTPFQLEELVSAFVKLKAYGLDPSKKSLTAYGNTASAMGKTLEQMIEAVADASVFEFERLKEFGIKARQQTDSITMSFRGTTTKIGKNSQEIIAYLEKIGTVDFAGAMEEQSKTLGGAISNLQDAMTQALTVEGDALDNLTSSIVELANVLKEPATIAAIQSFAEGIMSIAAASIKAGTSFSGFLDEFAIDLVTLAQGSYDATSALRVFERQLNAVRFAKGVNAQGLFKNFDKIVGFLPAASIQELETGLGRIGNRIKEIAALNQKGLGSENLELELQVLKDLRDAYLDARDAALPDAVFARKEIELIELLNKGIISLEQYLTKHEWLTDQFNQAIEKDAQKTSKISEAAQKAIDKYNAKMMKLGQKITEAVEPQAKFNRQEAELIKLLDEGFISLDAYIAKHKEYSDALAKSQDGIQSTEELNEALNDTYSSQEKALKRIRDRINELNESMKKFPERADEITDAVERLEEKEKDMAIEAGKATKDMTDITEQAAKDIKTAWDDFLFDPFDDSLDDMLKSFMKTLKKMLVELAAKKFVEVLAQIGVLAGPSADVPSADGGGFTGNAPRTGGLDGKGGFLAMLHPQETVIDHTKGQSQPVSINFNIQANDTRGFDDLLTNRRGLITNMVNQALNNSGKASLV